MSNTLTLTALTETLFQARDTIARELVGFIPSVTVNAGSEGVSIGGTVQSMVTAAPTVNSSITPAMTIPAADDQTISAEELTIGQTANVRIPLNGEQFKKLEATVGGEVALKQMFTQAMRAITNTIEAHVASVAYKAASRATGTAGTTPFASNFNSIPDLLKILKDNGCPDADGMLSLIVNTSAGTKLRQLSGLYKVNESGSDATLRRGELLNLSGFSIKESAQVQSHTKGAGTGYDIGAAGEAIGQTTLTFEGGTVNTTGIKAGDVITFDTDTANKYVVKTGSTATAGDVIINKPGLLVAGVDASELTIGDSYAANVGLHKSAVELVMRPPAEPPGGDSAEDRMTIFDPVSGLVFDVSLYKGYKMNMLDLTVYYQAKAWKSEFIATLLG